MVLSAFGGTRGTDRHCGGTTEYWVVLEVLGSNRGVLWGTVGYFRVWLGAAGCWGVLGGGVLMGPQGVLGAYWGKEGYWGYFGILQGTLGTGATGSYRGVHGGTGKY